jgi:hypothetical protein
MKLRDAAGVLKTVGAIKVRDATGALKTVSKGHVRDSTGAQKTFFDTTAGGGGATVTIAPANYGSTSASALDNTSDFTATFSSAPTSIVWSIVNPVGASGAIISGQGTATARVTITNDGAVGSIGVRCTAVIGGVAVSATVTKTHRFTGTLN